MSDSNGRKPSIVFNQWSPYMVVGLERADSSNDETFPLAPVASLCRCGASAQKPYCDGSHARIGFSGAPDPDRPPDRVKEYVGKEITVRDARGVCTHSEVCIHRIATVFRKDGRPWIDADGADADEIVRAVNACPSGALSYVRNGQVGETPPSDPALRVVRGGPLEVSGGIELIDDLGSQPADPQRYALCRCGASKNKPFCDGSHAEVGFEEDTDE